MFLRSIATMGVVTVLFLGGAGARAQSFRLTSPEFKEGGALPRRYTCDGESVSPPLTWSNPPAGTQSFALTMHHVPGPGEEHVYWVVYNIPAAVRSVTAGDTRIGNHGVNTINNRAIYAPPCSKGPGAKWYTLTLYALSKSQVKLAGQASMDRLLGSIKDCTLASTNLRVSYSRPDGIAERNPPPSPPERRGLPPGAAPLGGHRPNLARIPVAFLRDILGLSSEQTSQIGAIQAALPPRRQPSDEGSENALREIERDAENRIIHLVTVQQRPKILQLFQLLELLRRASIPQELLGDLALQQDQITKIMALAPVVGFNPGAPPDRDSHDRVVEVLTLVQRKKLAAHSR